jgi:homoserine kinase
MEAVGSMTQRSITAYAPASSGNLSVGFDALGLALAPVDGSLLGDIVQLRGTAGFDWELKVKGPFAQAQPVDPEDNIVIASCRRFETLAVASGARIRPLAVELDKRLPVGSGLGSSASSIVATLVALNHFFDRPLSKRTMLDLMAEMEGNISGGVHLDNIAPSLFGGLRLCSPDSAKQYGLPWPGNWRSVVAWPGTSQLTREARSVLPDKFDKDIVIRHGAQFATFVHALHAGDARLASTCLIDLIAEPYRAPLLPGFEEARSALMQRGALAVGISGSGPSLFCIVDDDYVAELARDWLATHYLATSKGFVHVCQADLAGARLV